MTDPKAGSGLRLRARSRRPTGPIAPIGPILLVPWLLVACLGSAPASTSATSGVGGAASVDAGGATPAASSHPDWYDVILNDVRTGTDFTVGDHAGDVVLIETIAEWCPTCLEQQAEVKRLHDLLGESADLVSVSLDVDVNEDAASLRTYATALDLDWYVAVAPLAVARALGNLYSAEYLNPPLSPMLVIDRDGNAIQLPYGLKNAEALREILEPYLAS